MSKAFRWRRWPVAIVCVGVLIAAFLVPTPLYVAAPGTARDVAELVMVMGTSGGPAREGRFLLTTISIQRATVVSAAWSLLDPSSAIRHQREFLPEGTTWEDYLERSRRMMVDSQAAAKVAALSRLGYEARIAGQGARVAAVLPGSRAHGLLLRGDVITAVDGRPVEFAEDLVEYMAGLVPGTAVRLSIRRAEETLELAIASVEHPQYPERAALRVSVETAGLSAEVPLEIEIAAGDISGPSAGLMFALEIIDQLQERDLAAGLVIAGTGTVDPRGRVGPVGGVPQKVVTAERAGASVFLVPMDNELEARRAARRIEIVAVSTLDEALTFLAARR